METYLSIMSDEIDDPLLYQRRPTPIFSGPYVINRQTRSQVLPATTLPELCNFCKETISQWPRVSGQETSMINHYGDVTSLQTSADQGCGLCARLIVGAEEYEDWWDYLEADGSVPRRGVAVYQSKARSFWPENYMRLKLLVPCTLEALGFKVTASEAGEPAEEARVRFEVDMYPAAQRGETFKKILEYTG